MNARTLGPRRCCPEKRLLRPFLSHGRFPGWSGSWAVALVLTLFGVSLRAAEPRLTFFGWSDQHVQTNGDGKHLLPALAAMQQLPGTPFPQSIGGSVDTPAFVFGCGDITEWPTRAARDTYDALLRTRLKLPVSLTIAAGQDRGQRVVKRVLKVDTNGENLLSDTAWRGWGQGFQREGRLLACNNGLDATAQRGASQAVALNQRSPEPILATVWSRAENVTGTPDSNYALYLDLLYVDGDHLWGQAAAFDTSTHDWQQRRVVIVPDKPVANVSVHLLLRGHGGQAWFRDPQLFVQKTAAGAVRFDGVAVVPATRGYEGFQLRDVAANSDYVAAQPKALGIELQVSQSERDGATFFDVQLQDTTGRDRAVTLIYSVPVAPEGLSWLQDPRRVEPVVAGSEYSNTSRFRAGANGRLSKYPLGGVASATRAAVLGLDMAHPAFYRIGYHAACGELFIAFDLGLAPEKPTAHMRFCRFEFDGPGRFRAALARYYDLFPADFACRVPRQGLWMPFAKISQVADWQDFGFRFKEGNDETAWDDAHDIVTFRYTEPMTWWMRMPKQTPRTLDAAVALARQLAEREPAGPAQALLTSGYHDESGGLVALIRDTPWCDGAVWSMNSMPGITGEVTDFRMKWNDRIKARYYGAERRGDLDGEYIDSSEGYVTAELDFRRDHLAAATTPLCFSPDTCRPAVFRGAIAFEYIRGIADDIHAVDRLMMANSTPIRLCWLAPLLDVLGTETDWNSNGHWRPMTDEDLLYRRVMCKGKPYCFLMNTRFETFSYDLVEKYMKRALAYGMFPGFFSHNASQGHYFTRPELYNRDRPLFKKYVPLCRLVAEAGWEPVTRAASSDQHVYVERFGRRYLTVLNDSGEQRTVEITVDGLAATTVRDLVADRSLDCRQGRITLTLAGEDVALLDLAAP